MTKSNIVQIFTLGGVFGLISALIHLYSGLTNEFTSIVIGDIAINTLSGLILFTAAWLLKQGNEGVIYVVIAWIVLGIGYAIVVDRGLNFIFIIAGAYIFLQLNRLKSQGGLKSNIEETGLENPDGR